MQNDNVFHTADHANEYIYKTIGVLATHPARIKERLAAAKQEFGHIWVDAMPDDLDQLRDEIWGLWKQLDDMSEDEATSLAGEIFHFAGIYREAYEESRR